MEVHLETVGLSMTAGIPQSALHTRVVAGPGPQNLTSPLSGSCGQNSGRLNLLVNPPEAESQVTFLGVDGSRFRQVAGGISLGVLETTWH